MTKHPAGPFTVRVQCYSLEQGTVGAKLPSIYSKRHRSPNAAARNLAGIISRRTKRAKEIHACIPRGTAGRFVIETGDGQQWALVPFRNAMSKE